MFFSNGVFERTIEVCGTETYSIATRDISSPWTRQVHLATQNISSHHMSEQCIRLPENFATPKQQ